MSSTCLVPCTTSGVLQPVYAKTSTSSNVFVKDNIPPSSCENDIEKMEPDSSQQCIVVA